jgi:peptidoglycan/xylan/chitin deacetylase (PgdA/CDA1 family)
MTPAPAGLTVLTYHSIGPERSVIATDPSRFADTMASFVGAGWRPVDLGDWIARGRPEERRGFSVTFDDGLRSIAQIADVVNRLDLRPTVFLVTDRVGSDNRWSDQPRAIPAEATLDWSEVETLARQSWRFASHGATHRKLDRLKQQEVVSELQRSRGTIEDHTGTPCRLLSYPYGRLSRWVRFVAARHYAAAFGTRLGGADNQQDAFDLSRIDAYYLRAPQVLAALVEGRASGWLRRRRALRSCRGVARSVVGAGGFFA